MSSIYLNVVLRSLVVYAFVILAFRLVGKKELAQLSVIDLVFILLISNVVQNAMTGPDTSLMGGLIAATALFLANYLLKWALFKFGKFEKILEGEALVLVYKGNPNEKNLKKSKITNEELEATIREHGAKSIDDVDLAMLETDGNISVLSDDFKHKTSRKRKAHKILKINSQ
jgi:uncharacterized membrane protein YcaP (DUF421 family)